MALFGCLWLNIAILGLKTHFGRFWGPKLTFSGGRKGPEPLTDPPGCEIQCSTMFTQYLTHLGLLGLSMTKSGNFRLKKTFLGGSGAENWQFLGTERALTDPLGCEIQCSIMFTQYSTHLGLLKLLKAKYGYFGSIGAIKWPKIGPVVALEVEKVPLNISLS